MGTTRTAVVRGLCHVDQLLASGGNFNVCGVIIQTRYQVWSVHDVVVVTFNSNRAYFGMYEYIKTELLPLHAAAAPAAAAAAAAVVGIVLANCLPSGGRGDGWRPQVNPFN